MYRVVQKKIAQILMLRHFATVLVKSHGFHRNAQKLAGNTKNWQILNIVIKHRYAVALWVS